MKFYIQISGRTEEFEENEEETFQKTIKTLYEKLNKEISKNDVLILKKINNEYLDSIEIIKTQIKNEETIILEILTQVEEFKCGKYFIL
jgi:hypothetical protein